MADLTPERRRKAADALLAYIGRRWVVCDHAQILDPGGAVDAVVDALAVDVHMAEQATPERLAEILWTARAYSRDIVNPVPLMGTRSYTRERYRRFAVEVAQLLGEDRDLEVERLRTELNTERRRNHYERAEKAEQRCAHAVAEVARIATDRDRARTVAANAEKTLGEQIDRAIAAEAERDQLRDQLAAAEQRIDWLDHRREKERAEKPGQDHAQVERVRALHRPVCGGACGLDDACECGDRDLVCAECNDRCPCPTVRALDGTEPGQ